MSACLARTVCEPRGEPSGIVFLCSPGGGFPRSTFDLHLPGFDGYSMADHLAGLGHRVVMVDLLGVEAAESTGDDATLANAAAALAVTAGELAKNAEYVIGLGHSLGAGVTAHAAAEHAAFNAVALLGYSPRWSALPPDLPGRPLRSEQLAAWSLEQFLGRDPLLWAGQAVRFPRSADDAFAFQEDVPQPVRAALYAEELPVPRALAVEYGIPELARATAAAITAPLLLILGAVDASPEPETEFTLYPASKGVTTMVEPHSAHCHQVSTGRRSVWDALSRWAIATKRRNTL